MDEIEEIKEKIIPILRKFNVTKAGILGVMQEGSRKKSDVDILAEIDDNFSLFEVINLKLELEKAVKRKVDLVEYELIRKEIKENVLKDEVSVIR